MPSFKEQVYNAFLKQLDNDIATVMRQTEDIKESLRNETKSTAGDKYETARAMLHIEQEKIAARMTILQQHKAILEQASEKNTEISDKIRAGNLVTTDKGIFLITASLGKIQIDGRTIHAVSAEAPLGKLLIGQKKSAIVTVNNHSYTIISFY